jgi:hypothetical protein
VPLRHTGRRPEYATWTLAVDTTEDLEPFDAALTRLLGILQPVKEQLGRIRPFCDFRLVCFGSSDSTQGGFWLSPECLAGLGWLGADVLFTVYLDESA